jgi:hypothetical protein
MPPYRSLLSLLCIATIFVCDRSHAAEITISKDKINNRSLIRISGELKSGDETKFREIALSVSDGIVLLDGPGGHLIAGLEIGRIIRLRGYATAVVDDYCYSSCALAWLAGQPRYVSSTSHIGFHAASFFDSTGERQTTGHGNALIGAYANSLGLSVVAIRFITTAEKDKMNYLTREIGQKVGISAEVFDDKSEAHAHHNKALQLKSGAPPDIVGALDHYRLAAIAGFAGSQNNLGDLYETGLGVAQNEKYAIYWYTRAAERGEATAYLSLSTLLAKDTEDQEILIDSAKFGFLALYYLPDGRNYQAAKAHLNFLGGKLPEEKLRLAHEQAKRWEPLYHEKSKLSDAPGK